METKSSSKYLEILNTSFIFENKYKNCMASHHTHSVVCDTYKNMFTTGRDVYINCLISHKPKSHVHNNNNINNNTNINNNSNNNNNNLWSNETNKVSGLNCDEYKSDYEKCIEACLTGFSAK